MSVSLILLRSSSRRSQRNNWRSRKNVSVINYSYLNLQQFFISSGHTVRLMAFYILTNGYRSSAPPPPPPDRTTRITASPSKEIVKAAPLKVQSFTVRWIWIQIFHWNWTPPLRGHLTESDYLTTYLCTRPSIGYQSQRMGGWWGIVLLFCFTSLVVNEKQMIATEPLLVVIISLNVPRVVPVDTCHLSPQSPYDWAQAAAPHATAQEKKPI